MEGLQDLYIEEYREIKMREKKNWVLIEKTMQNLMEKAKDQEGITEDLKRLRFFHQKVNNTEAYRKCFRAFIPKRSSNTNKDQG